MRKTKKVITETAGAWVKDLLEEYPDAKPEIFLDAPGGFDVYVRVEMPREMEDDENMRMLRKTVTLNNEHQERTGVNIVATVVDKEAVPNG